MNNEIKASALHYLEEYDFSVFPVSMEYDPDEEKTIKRPRVKWSQYQKTRPTSQQVSMWYQLHAGAGGIGIITGSINNLFVLDIDSKKGEEFVEDKLEDWPDPPKVRTGSGNSHIYFKYPSNKEITVGARIGGNLEGMDLDFRCNGGFVVAPPSLYPQEDGESKYKWETTLKDGKLMRPPEWLLKEIEENGKDKTGQVDLQSILEGVEKGKRNVSATKVAGILLNRMDKSQWSLAWETLQSWNENRNKPPLGKDELRDVFESIVEREEKSRELDEISITNGVELLETDYEREEIISDGILAPGQLALLIGPPKTGKTLLALDMLLSIANEKAVSWLNFHIDDHCNSLFLSGEGGGLLLQERLKKRGVDKRFMQNVNFWWPKDREKIKLNKKDHIAQIVKAVNATQAKVLFIDPFIKFHEMDENSTQDMASIMDDLWDIREQTGAAIVLVHHTRKGGLESRDGSLQETRGSSVSTGEVDTGLILSRRKGHNKMNLDFELRWAEEPKTHEMKLEDDLTFSVVSQYRRGGGSKEKINEGRIEKILGDRWMTVEEVTNQIRGEMSKSTARKKLNSLVNSNKAKKEKGAREDVHGNQNCYKEVIS